MANSQKVEIATIGKVVGLGGELKLHLQTDFVDQFVAGAKFTLKNGKSLEIDTYNPKRGLVKFTLYHVREDAAVLTNQKLYLTEAESRENCDLEENQYFWFDMIGSEVIDDGKVLGTIKDIERITTMDYLKITTSEELVSQKLSKEFYIPYIMDVYIERFDMDSKKLYTKDALPLLEAS
ncbi:MAG TPA: 16S rRNA processing protein RimM [Campylobacterales bacterium]|nr:16S rRNA processing protein RimM [Campylobacterales bacterium]